MAGLQYCSDIFLYHSSNCNQAPSTLGSSQVQFLNSEPFHYLGIGRRTPDSPKAEQNLFCLFTEGFIQT